MPMISNPNKLPATEAIMIVMLLAESSPFGAPLTYLHIDLQTYIY